jgi:hypothetical protein
MKRLARLIAEDLVAVDKFFEGIGVDEHIMSYL